MIYFSFLHRLAAAPATSCNFEEPTLCGWVHHDDTDVEWRLQMGQTKTSRTGPRHDHTFGAAGNGTTLSVTLLLLKPIARVDKSSVLWTPLQFAAVHQ
ncbi:MAG: hypothetical protein AB2693_31275, partial [Candidatus Thiodiazotropha sp.]